MEVLSIKFMVIICLIIMIFNYIFFLLAFKLTPEANIKINLVPMNFHHRNYFTNSLIFINS